jgi:hypothetical protein
VTRKPTPERDQGVTPFTSVLVELCRATGSPCSALVDREGETVDYAGRGDPFEIRILAAELRLLLQQVEQSPSLSSSMEILVRARRASFMVCSLPEGYALVVRLPRRSTGISDRSLAVAIRGLCSEAGFAVPSARKSELPQKAPGVWRPVLVDEDGPRSRRPCRLETEQGSAEVEIMGRIAAAERHRRERGFRVRLSNGEEGTLIREPLGRWFLEEDGWE